MNRGPRLRTPELIGLAVLAGAVIALSLRVGNWMLDDAFISFRYAENLVHGHGLVYNVGERVEGYTNFLWVIILSLFRWLGADTVAVSRILGVLLNLAVVILLWFVARPAGSDRGRSGLSPFLAAALLGSMGAFTIWGPAGMEVPLFALLLLLSVVLARAASAHGDAVSVRDGLLAGLVLALTTMTRPEGLLALAVVVVLLFVRSLQRASWKSFISVLAGFALLYLPYYVWRYSYYGYPLPNTFYAKVGASSVQVERGLLYLLDFARSYPQVLIPALAGAALGWKELTVRLSTLVSAVFLIYIIAVGGDCMPGFRFLAPIAPLFCLLAAKGILGIAGLIRTRTAGALLAAAIALTVAGLNLFAPFAQRVVYPLIRADQVVYYGRIVGERLRAMARSDAVLATNTGGSVPYYSGLKTIDMLGLNDTHIAHVKAPMGQGRPGHEKADGAYVLSRNPDYVQFCTAWGSEQPHFRGDSELYRLPEFRRRYVFRTYPLEDNLQFGFWEKRNGAE
jgi:4-amino-4-deoxy-L-arabinose transferase-like glycosyltransferase